MGMLFDWDSKKEKSNVKKHNVTFDEASTAFDDVNAIIDDDDDHVGDEDRFVLLGYSKKLRLLIVCHCYRGENKEIIRIYSARKANQVERRRYEERG